MDDLLQHTEALNAALVTLEKRVQDLRRKADEMEQGYQLKARAYWMLGEGLIRLSKRIYVIQPPQHPGMSPNGLYAHEDPPYG